MNLKKLKDIVSRAKDSAPNREALELAEQFEEFIELFDEKKNLRNPEDFGLYYQKVERARTQLKKGLDQVAASFGMQSDQMQQYFRNPENFSSSQWLEMQDLKKEALGKEEKPNVSFPHKKLRRKKESLKV